jgi:hypothetical protein
MNLKDDFEKASPYQLFRNRAEKNQKVLDEVYAEPNLMHSDLQFLKQFAPLNILAIGEEWCPDVVHTVPRWARLAEELEGIDFRIVTKSDAPQLMQDHLGPGNKERIPVYIFLDCEGNRIMYWSGRSRVADRWILARRNRRGYNDIPQEEMKRFARDFRVMYRESFRRHNFEEIKDALAVAFAIPFDPESP